MEIAAVVMAGLSLGYNVVVTVGLVIGVRKVKALLSWEE